MKDSTVLWNCNLFKTVSDSDMRTQLVKTKSFANKHSENLQMIKANLSWHPGNHMELLKLDRKALAKPPDWSKSRQLMLFGEFLQ